jgi:hydroxylaminobenzene mutase
MQPQADSPISVSVARLSRRGQRLFQIGIVLLFYSSIDGFLIPHLASPRIGLSVHTLSALQAVLTIGLGALWPRLDLGVAAERIAFWGYLYSAFAILIAYTIAAFWGVGIETIALMGELPNGLARGTPFQETFIRVLAYSSATGVIAFALILWGLRMRAVPVRT